MRKPYILMSLLVLSTLLSACSTVSGSPAVKVRPHLMKCWRQVLGRMKIEHCWFQMGV